MIVDSTRKGKRFPDSMSKTIPIWTCVMNRAIWNYRMRFGSASRAEKKELNDFTECGDSVNEDSCGWDCSLHVPLWVSNTERALIEMRLDGWVKDLEISGADIASIASLKKPLRPLWISQKTVIWLNEVPDCDSWDFTPLILVSASSQSSNFQQRTTSEFSWRYIAGAGDDEESWARGLSPNLFWKHAYDLISSGPDLCNKKVADIVETDRVHRARRGENAPQISLKVSKSSAGSSHFPAQQESDLEIQCSSTDEKFSNDNNSIFWLGETNLAVGTYQLAKDAPGVDCVLSCDRESSSLCSNESETYLNLSIVSSKFDRFSLLRNLPSAVNFAKNHLREGKRLLICCSDGEDISICVCLAILMSLFDDRGNFDEGRFFSETQITKHELRRRIVFICQFAVNARPSRGNVKQVFNYLIGGNAGPTSLPQNMII